MNNTHIINGLRRILDESLSKTMSKLFLIFAVLAISCEPANLTDLTPDNGHSAEFAFSVIHFNKAISTEVTRQDTGWHVVTDVPIRVLNPFVDSVLFISTDTFAFEKHDYEPVLKRIHRIANGQDITFTTVKSNYTWLNYSQMYSTPQSYLIPLFNADGQRYWIQVFKQKQSFWFSKYTARGIWAISKPKKIDGDVS